MHFSLLIFYTSMRNLLFTITASALLLTALPAHAATLSDIAGSKNREAIQFLNDRGIIGGYPDGTFKPQNTVNRAELLKILVGGKGVIPTVEEYHGCFPDVAKEWFAPFVCYAKEQGWIGGYPDGSFRPSATVNKVEAIKMIVNSQGYSVPDTVSGKLYDDADASAWYAPFVQAAKDKGILEETRGMLGVASDMRRGSVAESIYRAVIVREQALPAYPAQETAGQTDDDNYEYVVKRIDLQNAIENWDDDVEKDGLVLGVDFYFVPKGDPKAPEEYNYPKNQDWTVKVSIYDPLLDSEKFKDFNYHKGQLLYEHTFGAQDVEYNPDGLLFVRIPKEQMKDAGKQFGWVEVTVSSGRGTFSTYKDYMWIRDESDPSLSADKQVKKLNLKSISILDYWTSWDADAEKDGFKLTPYFKDDKGEQVYPNSTDWTVTVDVFASESEYDKYGDFSQHRVGSPVTLTFKGRDVLYESLGYPYVHVPKEKLSSLKNADGYFIVEAEFSSTTYGTFSAQKDVPDWSEK